jgi:hypothetical protein
MKRKPLLLLFLLAGAFVTQTAKAETCNTQTRTAYDENDNVVASATCTRCNEDPVVARVQAGTCADAGLQVMLPY